MAAIQGKIEGVPVPEIETTPAMKAARDAYQRVCDENAQLRKDRDGMHAHISRIARDNERLGFFAHELRNLLNTALVAFEAVKSGIGTCRVTLLHDDLGGSKLSRETPVTVMEARP